ncbi:LANO_0C01310g1_1 [Lachancea nothofagi CBS 11611]|uniref:LANO_0C01310g1_1 n=1 Tax=Lachancea nothofagi CBS 11611 TaxID=1266666 RepID=A0A1G4J4G4_9SACH|nr:LANO_0C01310g1_1 [Lachancea nothofagi CBS 11611]
MLSSSFNSVNALCTRSRLLVRWNTTAATAARKIHPVSQLSTELAKELNTHKGSNSAFELFKDRVQKVSESLQDSRFTLQRSFGLNSVLTQLLQASRADLTSLDNASESSQLPKNPYEILTSICEYGLARDSHFQVVFEHLIASNSPQDVLGLWVKYLETLSENSKTITYGTHHANNSALASIGYLMLPGNSPNLAELAQILNVGDKLDEIPISRIRYLLDTIKMEHTVRKSAKDNYALLLFDFVKTCKPEFENQLEGIEQVQDVQNLFQTLSSASKKSGQPLSTDIISAFMYKFTNLHKPQQAIICFNLAKQLDQVDLLVKNALLVAVANIPVFGRDIREQKAKRIEAVWNTYIATPSATITVDSYIALLTALGESRNFQELQQLWNNEIPAPLKADQTLLEAYLLFQSYRKNFSLEGIQAQLPKRLKSIKLANEILFKMAEEKLSESKIEQFYREQFADVDAPLKPDSKTLALRMYINYLYTKDPEFQFLKSISKSKNDINTTNSIFKKFTEFCPDIEITRKLFEEIQTPLDSRKYGYMITAESKAGNVDACEDIFKKFASETKRVNTITRSILDPIIDAVCEQSIRDKSSALLEKISIYATFAKKAQKSLTFQAASKIVHTLAVVSKSSNGNFSAEENNTIGQLLEDINGVKNFTPAKRDLEILIQNKISLPQGMK